MTRIGVLDCFSGAAGDMWVAACLAAGVELEALRPAVASLGLPGVDIAAEPVMRAGMAATRFTVIVDPAAGAAAHHRHLPDILGIIDRADIPEAVRERAVAVFRRLAEVEATAHGTSIEAVHFHEVGAEDAIVDVTCACLATHLLGIEELYSSAVVTGSGTVECAHGTMPVPAPGALGNLIGIPVRTGGLPGERVTPTGAALLRVLVDAFEPDLTWIPEATGLGAGARDDASRPNVLRLTVGNRRDPGAATRALELSCTLDTATGEHLGFLIDGLLERGALDAFAVPAHMKKGRPGHVVTALATDGGHEELVRFLLEESTSLGVRIHPVDRSVLERWSETVATEFGDVRYKVWRLPSGRVRRRPEADDVVRIARERGLSRGEVLDRLDGA